MDIGERVRLLREEKKLSQGDIEERTGLIRCYISRVENGHTVPNIMTLEKLAKALEIPMHHLLYEGDKPPKAQAPPDTTGEWGSEGKDARYLRKLRKQLAKMDQREREALLAFVKTLTRAQGDVVEAAPKAKSAVATASATALPAES
jgi:transcriptional regulator with XRE-family HTH domain